MFCFRILCHIKSGTVEWCGGRGSIGFIAIETKINIYNSKPKIPESCEVEASKFRIGCAMTYPRFLQRRKVIQYQKHSFNELFI